MKVVKNGILLRRIYILTIKYGSMYANDYMKTIKQPYYSNNCHLEYHYTENFLKQSKRLLFEGISLRIIVLCA